MSEWKKRLDRKIEIFAGEGIGRVGRPARRARRIEDWNLAYLARPAHGEARGGVETPGKHVGDRLSGHSPRNQAPRTARALSTSQVIINGRPENRTTTTGTPVARADFGKLTLTPRQPGRRAGRRFAGHVGSFAKTEHDDISVGAQCACRRDPAPVIAVDVHARGENNLTAGQGGPQTREGGYAILRASSQRPRSPHSAAASASGPMTAMRRELAGSGRMSRLARRVIDRRAASAASAAVACAENSVEATRR